MVRLLAFTSRVSASRPAERGRWHGSGPGPCHRQGHRPQQRPVLLHHPWQRGADVPHGPGHGRDLHASLAARPRAPELLQPPGHRGGRGHPLAVGEPPKRALWASLGLGSALGASLALSLECERGEKALAVMFRGLGVQTCSAQIRVRGSLDDCRTLPCSRSAGLISHLQMQKLSASLWGGVLAAAPCSQALLALPPSALPQLHSPVTHGCCAPGKDKGSGGSDKGLECQEEGEWFQTERGLIRDPTHHARVWGSDSIAGFAVCASEGDSGTAESKSKSHGGHFPALSPF